VSSLPKAPVLATGQVPGARDLSDRMPPVGSQGDIGSCTSWAVGYALKSYQEHIQHNTPYSSRTLMSPSFMHNRIRVCSDSRGGCGATIASAFEFLQNTGICSLSDKPYSWDECNRDPTPAQLGSARENKIKSWGVIKFSEIQSYISSGFPVCVGVMVHDGNGGLQNPRRESNRLRDVLEIT
jgi:hypothetical protein